MKTIFTLCFTIAILFCVGQSFNNPSCVIYDYAHSRYLVSNKSSGSVLSVVPGNGGAFFGGVTNPMGMAIVKDTLYVGTSNGRLKAFNLNNGQVIFDLNLGSYTLYGACADNNGNIYLGSTAPRRILRFDVASRQFNVFKVLSQQPLGVGYDALNERLVIGTAGNSAIILGLNIIDSSLTILKQTSLTNIKSIAIDQVANVFAGYDSSTTQGVFLFDSGFVNPPINVVSFPSATLQGLTFFNQVNDTLAVPDANTDSIYYYGFPHAHIRNDSVFVNQRETKTVCVLENDLTLPDVSVSLQSLTPPRAGTAVITGNCIEYTADSLGLDTVFYNVCTLDTISFCSKGILFINTLDSADNHAPFATDNFAEILVMDTVISNVTIDDLDAEGDSLCVRGIISSSRFSLDSANCSRIIFIADSFITGNDTCLYIVCDNDTLPLCDTAMLVVIVKADSSLYPNASFDFSMGNFVCYEVKGINTTPNDTGTARWLFKPQNGFPPYTAYGDTAYYLNMNSRGFFGEICLYVSNEFGTDSVCEFHAAVCEDINEAAGLNAFAIIPNPANNNVNLMLDVSESSSVTFVIESVDGRLLNETAAGYLSAGQHSKNISVAHLANGLYLIGCKTAGGTVYRKMLVQH